MRILVLFLLALGLRAEASPVEHSCPLCVMSGECGCRLGHVVCCDGSDAYGCPCR